MNVVMHASPEAFPVILMVRVYQLVTQCVTASLISPVLKECSAFVIKGHGVQEEFSPNFI